MFGNETWVGAPELVAMTAALARLDQDASDADRIDRIRALEELKSAAAAAQAVETAAFAASQRAAQAAAGVPAERVGRGISAQVGLARRVSPFHATRYTGWATILTRELPETLAALRAGRVSEWRAMIVARESAWLSVEDRAALDAELAPGLGQLSERRVEADAKTIAYRLDPHGYVARIRGAATDRRVTMRPAPDTMARLTGFLPVAQGVAAYAALTRHADTLRAAGDPRGRGQIMADTLVERLTGQARAADVPVEVMLIMTDHTLFDSDSNLDPDTAAPDTDAAGRGAAGRDEPARLVGYGPIPADIARDLALDRRHPPDPAPADRAAPSVTAGGAPRWLRRLYTTPGTGALVAMDSRRRRFTAGQCRFVIARDNYCRTPWCGAPIRHADHVRAHADGGSTHTRNGQGLCEACNHARQAPGWTFTDPRDAGIQVEFSTSTGHHYSSQPPDPPGAGSRRSPDPQGTQTEADERAEARRQRRRQRRRRQRLRERHQLARHRTPEARAALDKRIADIGARLGPPPDTRTREPATSD